MDQLLQRLTPDNITAALQGFYAPAKPTGPAIARPELIELLERLPALSAEEHVDPMLVQIEKHHRGTLLTQEDHALLAYVDDCVTQILRQTDLDFRIEAFIRDLTPFIASIALRDGVKAIFEPQPILNLIDTLINEGIGWSEDLGVLGEQFMAKIESMVRAMVTQRLSLAECQTELEQLFAREKPITKKMEQRLLDTEMKVLHGQKARYHAAELLNQQMLNKPLPLFIIFMLQGSWYEFLQQVFRECGADSAAWSKVAKLTEAVIWSAQPQADTQRHQTLMKSLPGHVQVFCEQLDFDTAAVTACLADLESEHEAIRCGTPSSACDFALINVDASPLKVQQRLDAEAMAKIPSLAAGQWYLLDDKDQADEKLARVKLILNWQDSMRLLFTNHNRRKVLHMNYAEFAYNMAEGNLKPLNPRACSWEIIKQHLSVVVEGVQAQKQLAGSVDTAADKQALTREYLSGRKRDLLRARKQHQRNARLKLQRTQLLREKAQQKVDAATAAINSLRTDAWLKLPVMEGTLTPCKLVAVIPAADNYIFANRNGLKVGEFTKGQLVQMLITENSEILDTGAEFARVLSDMVVALRQNKHKSYDELTRMSA
ncbi:MAG: DUF1631 domain-containing protein [Pseudomonadales bacterium]|nr:DUF1631 domain-containing protein [Pseudomonadales bacterium]